MNEGTSQVKVLPPGGLNLLFLFAGWIHYPQGRNEPIHSAFKVEATVTSAENRTGCIRIVPFHVSLIGKCIFTDRLGRSLSMWIQTKLNWFPLSVTEQSGSSVTVAILVENQTIVRSLIFLETLNPGSLQEPVSVLFSTGSGIFQRISDKLSVQRFIVEPLIQVRNRDRPSYRHMLHSD